jgi:uncharacterized protein (DUF952 family)
MNKSHIQSPVIFKIVAHEDWARACAVGTYSGSADDIRDGFIHLSAAHQLQATAAKHFRGQDELLLVAYDPRIFGADLKWEIARSGEYFPHLYAFLPTQQALWTIPLTVRDDGVPIVPEDLNTC